MSGKSSAATWRCGVGSWRWGMGSPEDEPERASVEGPRHRVRLEGFLMGQTTVTQAQWRVETAAGGFQSN